ncbi:hypothetical protein T552_02991 [Pneumocystis carinii B80]|uniref:Vacuolar-sorting protein SNF8 n=1 Tax=Pneumocystis carinii (strain B80) TaxID=1408658 RepID=A0A0W4ZCE7_PNEC8|nr:hypothetical protein T552_02991 [Pneumocystis carinii B80]KTW26096.1 hypothetical protein T552_02991 [Pneumocystis carinii B80]
MQKGRRGVGLGAFENQEKSVEKYRELSSSLFKERSEDLFMQLSAFKGILAEFARNHGPDIYANPYLRNEFSQMCKAIGIDPLASTGSKKRNFWSDMLNIHDFYFGLAVEVVELCRNTRGENGGLIRLEQALRRINEIRQDSGGVVVSEEDILRSVKTLDILSSGLKVVRIGGQEAICSLPNELNSDQFTILEVAQVMGYVSFSMIKDNLHWDAYRILAIIEDLLSQSLLWVDEQAEETKFWLPLTNQIC